ncbi:MAG: ABC transporter substrate-binding protein [Candidatus Rokubacteria bacterium]|nr:ABC transporter substrate-binding protein [Candidatus Rokubacteria bacterium]
MTRRFVLILAAALVLAPAVAGAHHGAREVIFLGFGGTHEKNMKERVIPPFERATGIKVLYVTGTTASNFARVQAQKARPEADVLWNNDLIHVIGKKQGLFAALDRERVANLKDVYDLARDPERVGVMQGFQAHGLQYNTRVFKERGLSPPTSWYDLWKPEFKGRVGLHSWNSGYAHYFVAWITRLEHGSDAAFRKLKEVGPSAPTFPGTPAELDNLFKQGEVWIAHNGSSRAYELQAAGFPVDFVYPKEGTVIFGNWFNVLKGAPHAELAQAFVNYLIGAEAQALFAKHVFFGPINRQAKLDADTARKVPYGPEQVARMVKLDFEVMNAEMPRWTERWNKEIEGK